MKNTLLLPHPIFLICCMLFITMLTSCGSSKLITDDHVYFQNGTDTAAAPQKQTVIQNGDLLSMQVFSQTINQEQAAIFNINSSGNSSMQGYQVNDAGNIEVPVIGSVKAAGLTKEQLQSSLTQKLISFVKNPTVTVRFLQFNVNVLGEVRLPGTQRFQTDKVTIIDAISAAGDLTDYGKRNDITVIREENGKKIFYQIDLRKKNFFDSPAYLLQPNDIVYVSPNKTKLKNAGADPEKQRRTGLFLSITSVLVSAGTLIITALK